MGQRKKYIDAKTVKESTLAFCTLRIQQNLPITLLLPEI